MPRKRYPYWTPRGRRADVASGGEKAKSHGHTNAALGVRTSPFVSFWYCGGFPPTARLHKLAKRPPPDRTMLCWSLDALPAGVLTFRGPFVATGNGYFGTWLGFACALAFAWQEFY